MDKITIQAPATTANLGPGFDCLGIALDIFNEVTVAPSQSLSITVQGEGAGQIGQRQDNLVYRAMAAVFTKLGKSIPELSLDCLNRIPLARGLGSSAAAVAGGLVAANELMGKPLSPEELLQLGAKMEGHADNIAPALFGGCQLVYREGDKYNHVPVPLPPELKAVLFIPDFAMSTAKARHILPAKVSRSDAVFNIGRVSLLTLALTTGKLEYLKIATQDRLHQPARQSMFPAMDNIFKVALETGALGAFLSGAGSTILAFTADESLSEEIGKAMQNAATKAGVNGRVQVDRPSAQGTHRIPL